MPNWVQRRRGPLIAWGFAKLMTYATALLAGALSLATRQSLGPS